MHELEQSKFERFYPRGTKDELTYYATQFNSIELNATFYKVPDYKQVNIWKNKTPAFFRFFPKISNTISHYKRLKEVNNATEEFCNVVSVFGEKLGSVFLQLHDNFTPKEFEKLRIFLEDFPKEIPLAVEVRNEAWFSNTTFSDDYYKLLEKHNITNIIVDTAGRRDLLHMRLTTPHAFIRYVGANHPTDFTRLDSWVERIKNWYEAGLQNLYFFVHQNIELESPLLTTYFITKLNSTLNLNLKIPDKPNSQQLTLF